MTKIIVEFSVKDWVWLCEFLSTVIHNGELDEYEEEDAQRLNDLLHAMERGK